MHAHLTIRRGSTRLRLVAAASLLSVAALALAGCQSPTETLEVEDPDIINPGDVQSPAGANAVRIGALARLNSATSGGTPTSSSFDQEGLFMLGGLLTDEWNNGDSFIARQEIDQRVITLPNNFLTALNRQLHRARLSAQQAIDLLEEWAPNAPAWQIAEMYFVQAYVENVMGEHYCNGLVFSTVVEGAEQYGTPITTAQAFELALGHADAGLALITGNTADDQRVRNALLVTRGRILMNLNRAADAGTAVAAVPTTFRYNMLHSATTTNNQVWSFNNSARRYSVSAGEGTTTVGLDFANANDPRVPVCRGGDATCRTIGVTQAIRDDQSQPLFVQRLWTTADAPVTLVGGVEARLIEAEAALRASNFALFIQKLNQARTEGGVTGLAANLTDPGTDQARVDLLFRERAFWLFGRGHRLGDLRRLIRQYGRTASAVFPTGDWHKGGQYGGDVNLPIPDAERNNPNLPQSGSTCMDRNA
jgi:starch-binding outer membrane protein, SusD/RagB family